MRFTDRTLLRLLDADERQQLMAPAVGDALLRAAYVFDDIAVGDVENVTARLVALTPSLLAEVPFTLSARNPGAGPDEWQVIGTSRRMVDPVLHGVLEVSVTAGVRGVITSVTAVESESLADLAPALVATQSFDAAADALSARFPESSRDALVEVLQRRGVTDLDGLRDMFDASNANTRLKLTLVSDATAAPSPITYRLAAAVRITEDLTTGLADSVSAVATTRDLLLSLVDPPSTPAGMTRRWPYPAVLIFPAAALDDADLPIAAGPAPATDAQRRAARLTELTIRLRDAGIVPVAV